MPYQSILTLIPSNLLTSCDHSPFLGWEHGPYRHEPLSLHMGIQGHSIPASHASRYLKVSFSTLWLNSMHLDWGRKKEVEATHRERMLYPDLPMQKKAFVGRPTRLWASIHWLCYCHPVRTISQMVSTVTRLSHCSAPICPFVCFSTVLKFYN